MTTHSPRWSEAKCLQFPGPSYATVHLARLQSRRSVASQSPLRFLPRDQDLHTIDGLSHMLKSPLSLSQQFMTIAEFNEQLSSSATSAQRHARSNDSTNAILNDQRDKALACLTKKCCLLPLLEPFCATLMRSTLVTNCC
jgi:hypothetical protein